MKSYLLSTSCLMLALCLSSCRSETETADSSEANTNVPSESEESTEMNTEPEKAESSEETPSTDDKVLRHAVFFSFKEEATEEQVNTIVKAFRNLPNKIEEIIDFQWGVNNSPEGKNDGFTHCFLLTFKDEAGREVYLPHPAHKEFGSTLGGLNDQVFVIDYWGTASEPMEKELKHAVFFKFKDDADPEAVKAVEEAFAALPSKIDVIKRFEWGTNNSPEKHDAGFTHCFMGSFDSEEGRETYLPHADHKAFVQVLLPVLDKVRVMDFWAEGKLEE